MGAGFCFCDAFWKVYSGPRKGLGRIARNPGRFWEGSRKSWILMLQPWGRSEVGTRFVFCTAFLESLLWLGESWKAWVPGKLCRALGALENPLWPPRWSREVWVPEGTL